MESSPDALRLEAQIGIAVDGATEAARSAAEPWARGADWGGDAKKSFLGLVFFFLMLFWDVLVFGVV